MSYNFIRSLKGLQGHDFLQEINLESNQIIDIADIRYIRELKLLRMLNFNHNPIQELNDYRLSILFRLQMLTTLDETHVTAHEKVSISVYQDSFPLLISVYQDPFPLSISVHQDPFPLFISIYLDPFHLSISVH